MTSEVALMNRMAVALAADSAAIVTYWERGERKQRYFKGANKIFNLCSNHPVGLMTYGTGALQRMPWEVIVKAYRESRAGKPQDALADYPKDLFKFVANKNLFPSAHQDAELVKGVCETAGNIAASIFRADDFSKADNDDKRRAIAADRLASVASDVANQPFISDGCKGLPAETRRRFLKNIEAEFGSGSLFDYFSKYIVTEDLLNLSCEAFFKEDWSDLSKTGLVIAGYGQKEYFPSLEQYECFGVVLGTVIHRRLADECKTIDFETTSQIVPVAQDDMVNTFVFGASLRTLGILETNFADEVESVLNDLISDGRLSSAVDVGAIKATIADKTLTMVREHIWEQHALPLRRVVGMLSVQELAELAETFVSIESLKERVTSHTETVSGPIDVAVITRGDGFIWIKRKHYFDPELNVRFVARKHYEAQE